MKQERAPDCLGALSAYRIATTFSRRRYGFKLTPPFPYGWKDGRASLNKVSPVCCFFNAIDGGKNARRFSSSAAA
jgi:hypothetical protein